VVIEPGAIEPESAAGQRRDQGQRPAPPATAEDAIRTLIGLPMDEVEKRLILATLAHCGGNKSKAARQLQIGLKTLYRKLVSYGVKVEE
jgi:DNA-binding NtrC family response regulator